jgi:hypothetical protein
LFSKPVRITRPLGLGQGSGILAGRPDGGVGLPRGDRTVRLWGAKTGAARRTLEITFMGRMDARFHGLLIEEDTRALLLFSYWLAPIKSRPVVDRRAGEARVCRHL